MASITADFDTLMRQASMTAHDYLMKAIEAIDGQLGAGYAKGHPDLIAAFMKVSCADFVASSALKVVEAAALDLANAVDATRHAVSDLAGQIGRVEDEISSVATEISASAGEVARAIKRVAKKVDEGAEHIALNR